MRLSSTAGKSGDYLLKSQTNFVAEEQHVIIIVGGSLLAWHGLRDATRDVDSIRRLDDDMRTLWPHLETGFATATEVVDTFFGAFPEEPEDPYLN